MLFFDDKNTLIDFGPLPMWIYDLETFSFVDVNQPAVDLYGYSKDEFLTMTLNEIRPSEEIDELVKAHAQVPEKDGNLKLGVHTHLKKNGDLILMDLNGYKIQFEGRNCIIMSCLDVTETKRNVQKLKLFESVISNTNDAVFITEVEPINESGPKIIYVNEAFTKMTGYTFEEVNGKSPRFLFGPNTDSSSLKKIEKSLFRLEPIDISLINYKKNGDEYWANFSISPVTDEDGIYTHWIALQRDITSLKNEQIQKELLSLVSVIFSEATDLSNALSQLCELVVNFGKFSFCEIWLPNLQADKVRLVSEYYNKTINNNFLHVSKMMGEVGLDQGIQGSVWKEKKMIFWDENGSNSSFLRRNAAIESDIKSVMGLPLLHHDKIVGVIVAGSADTVEEVKKSGSLLSKLETFVGSEINRKQLEGDLHKLFKALPDLICLADFDGKFLKMNQSGIDLLEYPEDELIGASFDKFVYPADKHISIKQIQRLRNSETVFKFENRFLTQSGKVVWLSWYCNSINEEGIIYASAKNITEEKKLRELVEDASTLSQIGGWEIDLLNNRLNWSLGVHQIHETDPNNYSPEFDSAINFYRKDFKNTIRETFQESIKTGKTFDIEAALISANGNEVWVRLIGQAEMIESECIRIFGSIQDISSIKFTKIRLEALTTDLPGVAFQHFVYPDGTEKLSSVSQASLKIWGLTPEECERDNNLVWNQIKEGGNYEKVVIDIQNSVQNISQWHSKWRNILPNGEVRWHEGFGTPYRLPNRTILFNSVVFDITEEIKAESLYEDASKLARIGSWEFELSKQDGTALMYWSPMVRQILEIDDDYNPSLEEGFEFFEPSSKNIIQKAVENLIQTGQEFDEELLLFTLSGKEKWIRCIGKSERVQGKCTKILGSFQDIHSMKSTQIQLKETLDSISDAFYALDKNWNFTYFNKEAENLLQKRNDEVIGKNIWSELPEALNTDLEVIYRRVAKSGKSESFEYLNPSDGSWYELNAYPSNGGVSSYFKNIDERKLAAEQLKKSFDEKIKIIESIGDAFFTVKKDFTVTYWNKSAEDLIGVKREEIIGKNLWDVFPDAVNLPSYANYHKVLETNKPLNFEEYYGTWLELNAYPSSEGITVFFRDISLRKEADIRLKKAFEEKNKILESIGDAFFAVDNHWVVTYWNREAENIFGRKREQITGKNLWEVFADKINSDFYKNYLKAIEAGENVSFEEFYPPLNKFFEVSVYPSSEGISVYLKDITLRKQNALQIIQANERFEKVTQATTDAIWDWDLKNNIFHRIKGFEKLYGSSEKEIFEENEFWHKSIHPDDLCEIKSSLDNCLTDPLAEFWQMEYRINQDNDEVKTVIDKGMIIRNDENIAIRMIGAVTDVTESKKYQQELFYLNSELKKHVRELENTNEQLEQFAFVASHDLQEPIRMISSFLNLLQKRYENKLDEKAHQYIGFATDGAKRMKQIILDFLVYSRVGKALERTEQISLEKIVDDYLILRKRIIEEKSAVIIHQDLPRIIWYKAPLTQIIHCLLDNALKYSKQDVPPEIFFSVNESELEWVFEIKDNGIGIDPEFFDKIFVMFQRLHNQKDFEGTGIGLSIAKKHVESSGGQIWLESVPGVGSTFFFSIKKQIL